MNRIELNEKKSYKVSRTLATYRYVDVTQNVRIQFHQISVQMNKNYTHTTGFKRRLHISFPYNISQEMSARATKKQVTRRNCSQQNRENSGKQIEKIQEK